MSIQTCALPVCNFILFNKGAAHQLIRVCFDLNQDDLDRELNGLFEAMEHFNIQEGIIVTLDQNDLFERNVKAAKVIPAHEYLTL